MHPIIVQVLFGLGMIIASIFVLAFFMRGFFFKFLKVRTSLGRLVLIKIRGINRDFFSIGHIEDTFLIFKEAKEEGRVAISDSSVFYRCIGITWVDYDVDKASLVKPDHTGVTGFDFKKFQSLFLRALYKPSISTGQEKIVLILLILIAIGIIIGIILLVMQGDKIQALQTLVNNLNQIKGSVTPSTI